jgi:hypothetical protein
LIIELVPSAFFFISDGTQYPERSLVPIPRPQLDGLAADRLARVVKASVDLLP